MGDLDPVIAEQQLRKFQKELSAGTVSLVLLAVLGAATEPMYGYQIAKRLERVGDGVLSGKQSALYPVLRNLEARRAARKPRRAFDGRPAAPLLPHHRSRPDHPARMGRRLARHPRFRRFRPQGILNAMNTVAADHHSRIPGTAARTRSRRRSGAGPGRAVRRGGIPAFGTRRESRQARSGSDRLGRGELRRAGRGRRDLSRHRSQGADRACVRRRRAARKSALGRFFGVVADPRTYGALFYMLLSLATGIFYFTWVVTGTSLSVGLRGADHRHPVRGAVPRLGARAVAGRGPHRRGDARRTHAAAAAVRRIAARPLVERIKDMFTDRAPGATMLYFLLMLPLGHRLLHPRGDAA